MADISAYFSFTESESVSGVPGLDLPDPSPGSIVLNPVSKCSACPNRATRDGGNGRHGGCFESLSAGVSHRRDAHVALVALRNELAANMLRFQEARAIMGFAAGEYNLGRLEQNVTQTTMVGRWRVTSITGGTINLIYRTGINGLGGVTDTNPLEMVYATYSTAVHEDADGDGEGALHIEDTAIRCKAKGKVTFRDCILAFHRGLRAVNVNIPVNHPLDVYDEMAWSIEVDASLSVGGLDPWPYDSTEDPTLEIEFYIGAYAGEEAEIEPVLAQYALATSKTFEIPGDQNFELEVSNLIANPKKTETAHMFRAYGIAGTAETEITSAALEALTIHWDGAAYTCAVDMTEADLTAYDSVRIEYWVSSEDDEAEFVDCLGCSNYFDDVAYGKGCRIAGNEPEPTGLETFNPNNRCHQPTCSGFSPVVPQHPLDRTQLNILLMNPGFSRRQYTPGIPVYYIHGEDNYALARMADFPMYTPSGWHEERLFHEGGWGGSNVVSGVLVDWVGWELRWVSGFEYGPAGNNWTRGTELTGYDPNEISKSQLMTSSPDVHAYRGTVSGSYGIFQRVTSIDLVVPDIVKPDNYVFPGGVMHFGFWDEYFREVPFGSEDVVYTSYIQFRERGIDVYNRLNNNRSGDVWTRNKGSFRVYNYDYIEPDEESGELYGSYRIETENKVIEASSLASASEESISSFRTGDTCVAAPSQNRIQNWHCDESTHGPSLEKIKMGDTVTFSGMDDRPNKFIVTYARAYDGAKQNWQPDEGTPEKQKVNIFALKYIEYPLAEEFQSVAVTRNGGAVTLSALSGGEAPPVVMAKDTFYYSVVPIPANNVNRVYFKFANANLTATDADFEDFDMTVTTDAGTHTATNFNWFTDATYGANALTAYAWVLPEIDGDTQNFSDIESVTFRYKDQETGEDVFQIMEEIAQPATMSGYTDFQYSKVIDPMTPYVCYFQFPASVIATGELEIIATMDAPGEWNDTEFADARIFTLHAASLPTATWPHTEGEVVTQETYEEYGNRGGVIVVKDEEGLMRAWELEGNSFVGEEFIVGTDAVCHFNRPDSVNFATANDEAADTELTDEQYAWLGAMGRLYLKPIVSNGDCIFIEGAPVMRRELMPLGYEMKSIMHAIERMLSE